MELREQLRFKGEREFQERNRVPEWAHAEHLEMNEPLKKLWIYPDSFYEKKSSNIVISFFREIRRFRKMQRKHVIIFHNAEAMS